MADWTTRVMETVDTVVDTAQDKVVKPLRKLGRAIVYGLLGAFFFCTAFAVLAIGLFRILAVYIPEDVWAAHAIVGGIFVLGGLFLWSKRR